MVSKPVAAAGSVLGLTALAMLISVMVSQNFVVVTIPGKLNVYAGEGAAGTCQAPNYLGTLGIFKASYLPACTFNPAVVPPNPEDPKNLQPFAALAGVTSPTTEFGPLFPAQTCIGGKLGPNCKFTTCEEFYAENGFGDAALSKGAFDKVSPGLQELINATGGQFVNLTGLVKSVPSLLGKVLAGKLIGDFGTPNLLMNVTKTVVGAPLLAVTVTTNWKSVAINCITSANAPADPLFQFDTGYDCSGLLTKINDCGTCAAIDSTISGCENVGRVCTALATFVNGTDTASRIAVVAQGPFNMLFGSGLSPVFAGSVGAKALGTVRLFLSAALRNNVTSSAIMSASYVGGKANAELLLNNATGGNFADLRKFLESFARGPLSPDEAISAGQNQLATAWAAMAACSGSTYEACQTVQNYVQPFPTASMSNDKDPSAACILLGTSLAPDAAALGYEVVPPSACTYTKLVSKDLLALVKAFAFNPANPVPAIVLVSLFTSDTVNGLNDTLVATKQSPAQVAFLLGDLLGMCSRAGLSLTACMGFTSPANDRGVPLKFNEPHPIPVAIRALVGSLISRPEVATLLAAKNLTIPINGFFGSLADGTFSNFLVALGSDAAGELLSDAIVSTLGAANIVDANTTKLLRGLAALRPVAQLTKACQDAGCFTRNLYPLGYKGTGLINETSRPQRIADCLNNDKDISAFKTAQAMVTAAAVMMGLGMAAGFAALAVDKGPVAFGAGALSAIGGVLVVAALMVVKSAPVYSKIGGTPVDGKQLYSAAPGQLIAIVGGLLAIIGGITQAVSGCLNKAGSSDQLTTKVENTY